MAGSWHVLTLRSKNKSSR